MVVLIYFPAYFNADLNETSTVKSIWNENSFFFSCECFQMAFQPNIDAKVGVLPEVQNKVIRKNTESRFTEQILSNQFHF